MKRMSANRIKFKELKSGQMILTNQRAPGVKKLEKGISGIAVQRRCLPRVRFPVSLVQRLSYQAFPVSTC